MAEERLPHKRYSASRIVSYFENSKVEGDSYWLESEDDLEADEAMELDGNVSVTHSSMDPLQRVQEEYESEDNIGKQSSLQSSYPHLSSPSPSPTPVASVCSLAHTSMTPVPTQTLSRAGTGTVPHTSTPLVPTQPPSRAGTGTVPHTSTLLIPTQPPSRSGRGTVPHTSTPLVPTQPPSRAGTGTVPHTSTPLVPTQPPSRAGTGTVPHTSTPLVPTQPPSRAGTGNVPHTSAPLAPTQPLSMAGTVSQAPPLPTHISLPSGTSNVAVSLTTLPPKGPVLPKDYELETAMDYFSYIFGEKTFEHVAEQTNLYAEQCGREWDPIFEDEMKSFLGMIIGMGVHKLPALHDYWSQHPLLGVPGLTRNMGRNRFQSILQNLHLNDNSKAPAARSPNFDKMYKVRPILNTVVTMCSVP